VRVVVAEPAVPGQKGVELRPHQTEGVVPGVEQVERGKLKVDPIHRHQHQYNPHQPQPHLPKQTVNVVILPIVADIALMENVENVKVSAVVVQKIVVEEESRQHQEEGVVPQPGGFGPLELIAR